MSNEKQPIIGIAAEHLGSAHSGNVAKSQFYRSTPRVRSPELTCHLWHVWFRGCQITVSSQCPTKRNRTKDLIFIYLYYVFKVRCETMFLSKILVQLSTPPSHSPQCYTATKAVTKETESHDVVNHVATFHSWDCFWSLNCEVHNHIIKCCLWKALNGLGEHLVIGGGWSGDKHSITFYSHPLPQRWAH